MASLSSRLFDTLLTQRRFPDNLSRSDDKHLTQLTLLVLSCAKKDLPLSALIKGPPAVAALLAEMVLVEVLLLSRAKPNSSQK